MQIFPHRLLITHGGVLRWGELSSWPPPARRASLPFLHFLLQVGVGSCDIASKRESQDMRLFTSVLRECTGAEGVLRWAASSELVV